MSLDTNFSLSPILFFCLRSLFSIGKARVWYLLAASRCMQLFFLTFFFLYQSIATLLLLLQHSLIRSNVNKWSSHIFKSIHQFLFDKLLKLPVYYTCVCVCSNSSLSFYASNCEAFIRVVSHTYTHSFAFVSLFI